MTSSAPATFQGMTVGKYRLLAPIGHGGMADVFLALSRGPAGFNKLLVVKKLRDAFVHDPEFLAMFMDEARLAARLNHPHVVQTYEVGQDEGGYFIAMEFLDGQPLHRILQRFSKADERLPVAYHLRILADMLSGLHHAHELRDFDMSPLQVVHRDVTPQNVFVTYDGQVKLVDFGIAKAMDSVAETRIGMFKGKLAYMSPQQARGERVDRRADIFSAGVMLWEALAGRRMWKGLPEIEVARRLADGRIPDITEVRDDLPDELVQICRRALAPDVDERYASAEGFQHDLERYLHSLSRRSDARQIGKLVAEAFSEDRERMRATIDTQVRPLLVDAGTDYEDVSGLRRHAEQTGPGRGNPKGLADHGRASPDDITARYAEDGTRIGDVENRTFVGVGIGVVSALLISGVAYFWLASPPGDGELASEGAGEPVESDREDGGRGADPRPTSPGAGDCDRADKPTIELNGDLDDDAVLTCDKNYLLTHRTFVRPGVTLKIEAGTTIMGDKDTKGTLIVEPGGRLEAVGRPDRPIVFTSELPRDQRRPGDWGGVILLGDAPTNLRDESGAAKRGRVEGLPERAEYGGSNPESDSGILQFVRIEYSGIELGPNNEINGLTLAGVGRGTLIDHVQVRNTADDCFEFFGGTVDAKHLICQNPGDDALDFDLGYVGRLQFVLLRDDPADVDGSNGIEADNDGSGSTNPPNTEPEIYNVTLCGTNRAGDKENYGMLVRRGARVHVSNSVVMGFDAGIDIRDGRTLADIRSTVFFGNTSHAVAYPESSTARHSAAKDDDDGFDEVAWITEPSRKNATFDPGIQGCFDPADPNYKPSETLTEGARRPPDDGFFDPTADYLGAFRDAKDSWDAGWAVWHDG